MASRLVKIVSSVLPLHTKVLEPAQEVRIVFQQSFDFHIPEKKRHVSLGNFYEYMTQGLWGGKLQNRVLLKNRERELKTKVIYGFTKPDLVCEAKKEIGESKAVRSGESVKLTDNQMAKYKLLQMQEKDASIYFAIYRHSFPKIKSFKGTEDELFERLSEATYHSIVLPLSIILALYNSNTGLIYRYDGERFDRGSCGRSPVLNRFLTEPEKIIKELELDISDFKIQRFITSGDFRVEDYRIKPFPVLRISDVNHEQWIGRFYDFLKDDYIAASLLDKYYKEHPEEYDPRIDGCSDADEIDSELAESLDEDSEEVEVPF